MLHGLGGVIIRRELSIYQGKGRPGEQRA